MTDHALDRQQPSGLDRTINLAAVSWATVAWVAIVVVAVALRLAQLGHFELSPGEARLAHEAYRFYQGQTSGPVQELRDTGPAVLLLQAGSFFLFGASDTTARLVPALLGIGMVLLVLALRPVVGERRALGMAAMTALSPTLVYASRVASREIAVATFALVALVGFLRIGMAEQSDDARRRWALVAGVGLAATFGSGPSSLSVLLAMLVGASAAIVLDPGKDNAFRRAIAGLRATPEAVIFFAVGLIVTLLLLFTRLFTDFGALTGLGGTIADWGRLLTTTSTTTPIQFFLLALLLYEILAVVFSVVAAWRAEGESSSGGLPWTFFAAWFAAALLIFSFSSGSLPEHAVHVALPVVLLGGGAIGDVIGSLDARSTLRGRGGTLLLVLIGLVVAIFAFIVLVGRVDDALDQGQAIFEAAATGILALFPLAFAAVILIRAERRAGNGRQVGLLALLALLVFLGAYTLRSSIMLSFFNSDDGDELLAQGTSTPAVGQVMHRLENLSRDVGVAAGSARNPEGGRSVSIAIDHSVQWPYRWYLREFPAAEVVAEGQAPLSGAQVVIAPAGAGLEEAGYTPTEYRTLNRVPGAYTAPDFGDIMRDIFFPSHWESGVRFLLFRTLGTTADPASTTIGLTGELSNRIAPNSGPFGLYERVGAGNGRGQFNQPRGIAASAANDMVYVVDMGNARVERFDAQGEFVGVWGGGEGDLELATTDAGLGPTGIAVGPDGLVYICDTWNHRIVVVDDAGNVVREFGTFKDTMDSVDPNVDPGSFFGPRDIAVTENEIYVVDTGNERVQVFGLDGTFIRAWGGFGNAPEQLIEPVGIAIGADDRVYVADSSNARISIFATSGTPLDQWAVDAWAGNQFFEPYLDFDQNGFLYASSSATGSVEVLDRSGALVLSIREIGSETLEQPVGLAAAPDGAILITDKALSAVFRYGAPEVVDGVAGVPVQEAPPASPQASPLGSPAASPVASPADPADG